MEHYRKTSHSIYDLKVHLVWIIKYRKPVLTGELAKRVRELIRQICTEMDVEIIRGHVSRDHVHLLVSVPPHVSVSNVVKKVKGKALRLFVWVAPFIEPLQGRGRGLPDGSRSHWQTAVCCGSLGS